MNAHLISMIKYQKDMMGLSLVTPVENNYAEDGVQLSVEGRASDYKSGTQLEFFNDLFKYETTFYDKIMPWPGGACSLVGDGRGQCGQIMVSPIINLLNVMEDDEKMPTGVTLNIFFGSLNDKYISIKSTVTSNSDLNDKCATLEAIQTYSDAARDVSETIVNVMKSVGKVSFELNPILGSLLSGIGLISGLITGNTC
jgi:hypothetical protein